VEAEPEAPPPPPPRLASALSALRVWLRRAADAQRAAPPARRRAAAASLLALTLALLLLALRRAPPPHAVLFTNREPSALVAIRSAAAHSARPLTVHVVVDDPACCPELLLLAARPSRALRVRLYTLGELTLELVADGWAPWWARAAAAGGDWWVRPGSWDADGKHATPLNHARFYIPHFRFARRRRRLLFLDDDVVVQSDAARALALPLRRAAALLVSCNAITFDKRCGFFHLSWGRVAYRETSYFSWRPWADGNASAAECTSADDVECIAPGGFELLGEAAARIGGAALDWRHFAWNYGFVVVDGAAWRRLRLTQRYEAWLALNTERRIFPPTSIGFGLGLPFLVLAGAVQCYDPGQLRIVEGLAVLNADDMAVNGAAAGAIANAHVLHYTGELKPWLPDALPEFAAPYRAYDARAAAAAAAQPPQPMRIFALLGGGASARARAPPLLLTPASAEHAGAEWALSVLDNHPQLCAAGEAKGALHALRAFSRDALQPPSEALLAQRLEEDWVDKCARQALCAWRHFAYAVTAAEGDPGLDGYAGQRALPAWRAWWAAQQGEYTALLVRFLQAASGDVRDGLALPCACPGRARALGFKLLADWLDDGGGGGGGVPHALSAYERPHSGASALGALGALNATLIVWERAQPQDAYLSMLKSVASGQWHCGSADCVPPAAKPLSVNVTSCRNYVSWYRASLRRLDELLERGGLRHTRIVYEECLADQAACFSRLQALLGAEASEALPRAPPRPEEAMAALFTNWEMVRREVRQSCDGAKRGADSIPPPPPVREDVRWSQYFIDDG